MRLRQAQLLVNVNNKNRQTYEHWIGKYWRMTKQQQRRITILVTCASKPLNREKSVNKRLSQLDEVSRLNICWVYRISSLSSVGKKKPVQNVLLFLSRRSCSVCLHTVTWAIFSSFSRGLICALLFCLRKSRKGEKSLQNKFSARERKLIQDTPRVIFHTDSVCVYTLGES